MPPGESAGHNRWWPRELLKSPPWRPPPSRICTSASPDTGLPTGTSRHDVAGAFYQVGGRTGAVGNGPLVAELRDDDKVGARQPPTLAPTDHRPADRDRGRLRPRNRTVLRSDAGPQRTLPGDRR